MMNKSVRVNLAYLRLIRGKLSQRAVSEATGIGQKTLSALETGNSKGIEFATLSKLCAFLNCSPSDLLVLEDEVCSEPPAAHSLAKADELIAAGLKAAIDAPLQSSQELWSQFDAACSRVRASSEEAQQQKSRGRLTGA